MKPRGIWTVVGSLVPLVHLIAACTSTVAADTASSSSTQSPAPEPTSLVITCTAPDAVNLSAVTVSAGPAGVPVEMSNGASFPLVTIEIGGRYYQVRTNLQKTLILVPGEQEARCDHAVDDITGYTTFTVTDPGSYWTDDELVCQASGRGEWRPGFGSYQRSAAGLASRLIVGRKAGDSILRVGYPESSTVEIALQRSGHNLAVLEFRARRDGRIGYESARWCPGYGISVAGRPGRQ